jgi:hypothetical protein
VSPRAGLDDVESPPTAGNRIPIPRSSSPWPVAIPTELSWFLEEMDFSLRFTELCRVLLQACQKDTRHDIMAVP